MKRKLLIIFLSIVTVVCLAFGISACGGKNNPVTGESLSYTLNSDGNSYSVTGIGSVNSSTIEIPSTYNDLPVTAIGKSAFSNSQVSFATVIIPDSVTSIGEFAFYQCMSLTTITMGAGVTSIGDSAFSYCTSLTSVSMSNALTYIGEEAFYCCHSLESITIPDGVTSIGADTFYACESLSNITIGSKIASIGENAFSGCSALTGITIPNSVTSIGSYAFYNCISLESMTIPDSVVSSIGEYTFYNCTALKSAVIGDGVTYIDDMAFNNCELLANVTIGNSVISIETNAFGSCSSLESVVLGSGLETIGDEAFAYCSSLTSIVIPDSVTYIDEFAFSKCTSLTSVTIGENVTYIADTAFNDCYRLVEVYNLSSLNIVSKDENFSYYIVNIYTSADEESRLFMQDDYQFIYDVNNNNYCLVGYFGTDTELILPELSVNGNATKYYIRSYAFCECDSLTDVVISSGVTSVGYDAFYNCTSLTSVTIGKDVSNISGRAFYGCYKLVEVYNLSSLSLTVGSTSNGYVACYAINIYKSADTESHVFTQDDYQFIYDSKNNYYLIGYSGTDTDITLPQLTVNSDVVTYSINQYAFYKGLLTSVVIPDSVTSIGDYAFSFCNELASITIGENVETIGDGAFRYCNELASITIGENVETIGDSAFGACSSLASITLPDKVTTIGNNVFNSCLALTSVTIGKSVTSIGDYAFSYCSSLTEFNYNAISMADLSSDNGVFNYAVDSGIAVNIGDDVITIPSYLFSSCASKITSLTIGESVSYISNNAFSGLTALTEINFNATAMSDLAEDNKVFYNAGQSGDGITVNIGANVTKIPANLFNPASSGSYAPKITSVKFAESSECTSIGDYAFAYCTTLAGITNLPAAATFGTNIVTGCTNFEISTLYTIYNNANYLGAQMINVVDTTAEIIVVKDGTTSIAENAFANCTNLRVVYIPSSVTEIGDNALVCGADSDLIIYFGASSSSSIFNNYTDWLGTYSYKYTYNETDYSANLNYVYVTGISLTDDYLHTSSTVYGYIGEDTEITVPSALNGHTITSVGYSRTITVVNDVTYMKPLSSFIGVTKIIMPSTVSEVNEYAFYNNTTLTSVTFLATSDTLYISSGAFYGCINLRSVTFTEGAQTVLQYQSFYGCTSLKSITLPTAYTILGNAFEESGLTSLTITGYTYVYLYTNSATEFTQYTLSNYTAEQLAANATGSWLAYNWMFSNADYSGYTS